MTQIGNWYALARSEGSPAQVPVAGAARIVSTLTTPRFCRTLLHEIDAWMRIDHCALMRISPREELQPFGAEHQTMFQARGSSAAIAYIDHYHRYDPIRRLLGHRSVGGGAIMLGQRRRTDIPDRAHRRICYENAGIVERLSLASGAEDGGLVVLTLFRQEETGGFGRPEIDVLNSVAPLLMTAASRHIDLMLNPSSDLASWRLRLKILAPEMTRRERDIAAYLLAGATLREASEALAIAHSTVVTYRERAYERLGVSNLKELRSRFTDQ